MLQIKFVLEGVDITYFIRTIAYAETIILHATERIVWKTIDNV
jgi:hypothetical protein